MDAPINKSNPKKKHHYIPVFYLKGFINAEGSLWVYDKDDKGMFASSPEGIAYENNYFTFINEQGEKEYEIVENAIMELEGRFAGVIKKIHSRDELSNDERITFSFFVASMMVRVPNMRNNIRKATAETIKRMSIFMASHKENYERMIKKYEEDTRKKVGMPIEELRQWALNPDNYTTDVDPQYATAMALALLEDFAKVFFQMKWAFIRATNEHKFMTGDNPLRYFDPTHNPRSFYGVGLANKNIEVTLPLSKDVSAFGSWKSKEGYLQGKNKHIKHINRMTTISAVRFIFADEKSMIIDNFVKKYKGSHPVMVVG